MSDQKSPFSSFPVGGAARALRLELKSLQEEPVEGFRVKLFNESDMFEWEVAIFGPPDTLYEGGYFKALMRFPGDYPYCPPAIRFLSKFWHPNIFITGGLCISILHPPNDDPTTDHLKPSEKWSPAQNVRTVLLSVISLLNEPNISSPANVDACKMYRRWRDSKGADDEYVKMVKKYVEESKLEAQKEGVIVPTTVEEYCKLGKSLNKETFNDDIIDTIDFYAEDVVDDDDDSNEDEGNASLDGSEA